MSFYLNVIDGPDKGKEIMLTIGSTFIGRDINRCQLVLSDTKVSRLHAKILLSLDDILQVEDQNSRNGIYLNGKIIVATQKLVPGDVIRLGNSKIELRTAHHKEINQNDDTCYSSVYKENRTVQLKIGYINIGRDASNDIVLPHPMVSRFHARISSQAGRHILYDLNSTNGVYHNGQRVIGSIEILHSSLIHICGCRFYFDGIQLAEYDDTSGRVRIEAMNLSQIVKLPSKKVKRILNDISLVIEPREFIAVLGGSGSGKSTLLGALTGMRPASNGEILINGCSFYEEYNSYRSIIGYVPQDDIVHDTLTVREVFTYSARIRLPDDTSQEEILYRVSEVMASLGLTDQQNVLVKYLSGGQRKRVSIGVELLTKPGLFFLDEPTSGLDPGLEKIMMQLLQKLSKQGCTVILVTHATFNISLCDKVVFLTEGGHLAFFGTPEEALTYFNAEDYSEIYNIISTEKEPTAWEAEYAKSNYHAQHINDKLISKPEHKNQAAIIPLSSPAKVSSFIQFYNLTKRYAHTMSRDRKNLILLLLQPLVIALLLSIIFLHNSPLFRYSVYSPEDLVITEQVIASGESELIQENVRVESNRRFEMSIAIALMVFSAIWLGTSNAAREIVKELPVYRRERLVKVRIVPYMLSKTVVLALICLLQMFIFVTITFFGLSLPNYSLLLAAFFLISVASVMMGLTLSAIASNVDKASSAVPLVLIPQIVLSGAIVPMQKINPEPLQLLYYPAVSKWGYELVGGAICEINSRVALANPLLALSGSFVHNWGVLTAFPLILFVVAALAVWRKDKTFK